MAARGRRRRRRRAPAGRAWRELKDARTDGDKGGGGDTSSGCLPALTGARWPHRPHGDLRGGCLVQGAGGEAESGIAAANTSTAAVTPGGAKRGNPRWRRCDIKAGYSAASLPPLPSRLPGGAAGVLLLTWATQVWRRTVSLRRRRAWAKWRLNTEHRHRRWHGMARAVSGRRASKGGIGCSRAFRGHGGASIFRRKREVLGSASRLRRSLAAWRQRRAATSAARRHRARRPAAHRQTACGKTSGTAGGGRKKKQLWRRRHGAAPSADGSIGMTRRLPPSIRLPHHSRCAASCGYRRYNAHYAPPACGAPSLVGGGRRCASPPLLLVRNGHLTLCGCCTRRGGRRRAGWTASAFCASANAALATHSAASSLARGRCGSRTKRGAKDVYARCVWLRTRSPRRAAAGVLNMRACLRAAATRQE